MRQLEHIVLVFSDTSEILLEPTDIVSFDATDFRKQISTTRGVTDKQNVVCDLLLKVAPSARAQIQVIQGQYDISQIHIVNAQKHYTLFPIWSDAYGNPNRNRHQQTQKLNDGSLAVWLNTGARFKLQ